MLRLVAWPFFLVAILTGGCQSRPAQESRVVLIGIDGASWNLIDPLMTAGELPRLAELADRGASADLETVEPLISPTVWTSIATGRRPEFHGVTSFFADRRKIQVPTIWERLAASGVRVGLYDYLMTWPPRPLPGGFVVPGWLRRDPSVAPPDLFDRAGIPAYAYDVVDAGTLDDVVAASKIELKKKSYTWNRLAEALRPQVGAVTFYALDVMCHHFYHTAFPEAFDPVPATAPRFDGVIHETLREIDRAVGEIVTTLEAEDTVIVLSDHGSQASPDSTRRWGFDESWLLEQAGLDAHRDGFSVLNSFIHFTLAIEPQAAEPEAILKRLENLVATLRTPIQGNEGSKPILTLEIIRDLEQARTAGRPEWMLDVVAHHRSATAVAFVLPIPETFDRFWPAGEIELRDERYLLSAFAAPHDYTGDHHPIGIFIAAGGAIRPRTERTHLSVLDVAPLLFYLSDRPIPDDLEGRLDETLIEPAWLTRRAPRWAPADEMPGLPEASDTPTADEASDREVERRLRALGYID